MGIITEKDFIERIKKFDEYAFKAGERADKSVLDSHDFRYVKVVNLKQICMYIRNTLTEKCQLKNFLICQKI